jgi:hypothetical protein
MKFKKIIERNFTIDSNFKVYDDAGNEYRNEHGCVEFLEDRRFDDLRKIMRDDS